jgi:hypothetical protein
MVAAGNPALAAIFGVQPWVVPEEFPTGDRPASACGTSRRGLVGRLSQENHPAGWLRISGLECPSATVDLKAVHLKAVNLKAPGGHGGSRPASGKRYTMSRLTAGFSLLAEKAGFPLKCSYIYRNSGFPIHF